MKSNYKNLGQFISIINIRNKEDRQDNLLGVSTRKVFIDSVANTVGTDFRKYKIVKKHQFTYVPDTSRRGDKMGIAMLEDLDQALVSQAYTVFEVSDIENLDPEYLMMWFRRPEFDRYARFKSHGSVREIFDWEEMCELELPVPSIEKQREIVREYNVVMDRITLNEKLIQKFEYSAQAIYKQWFVDFEFPVSKEYAESIGKPELEGKAYKSSGGRMERCEELELDIPFDWKLGCFGDVATQFSGYSFKGDQYNFLEGTTVIRGENVTEGKLRFDTHKRWNLELPGRSTDCFLKAKDIVIAMDGSKVGKNWSLISPYQLPLLLAQRVCCVRAKSIEFQLWLYISIKVRKFPEYVNQVHTGTSVPHISGDQIMEFGVIVPDSHSVISKFNIYVGKLFDQVFIKQEETLHLAELRKIILQKMS